MASKLTCIPCSLPTTRERVDRLWPIEWMREGNLDGSEVPRVASNLIYFYSSHSNADNLHYVKWKAYLIVWIN